MVSGFDSRWLEILVCPRTGSALELVVLPESVRQQVASRFREHFRDEEPVVERGLLAREAGLVYPIVSEIPILLPEEALPASLLEPSGVVPSE